MLRSWPSYVRGAGCSSRWRPRLGPRLERTQALCGPCVSRRSFPLRFAAGEPGRSSTFRTLDRECSPDLPLFAGELLVGTHAAPSLVALFAHMVLSIAPAVASTSASYVRLTPRSARWIHNKGPPGRMGRTAALLSADCTGTGSCSLPLCAFSFTGPL
jgi:hypothetical protein